MEAQEPLPEFKVAQVYCEDNSVGAGCPERFGISMFGDSQRVSGVVLEIPLQLILFEQGVGQDEL